MYRRFQQRFGTAGVIVAVIALVAALSGTALAAKGALTGKQKKEVEKIAKKYAGKPGAPGAPGANGANGSNGKDGAPGAPGEDGTDGEDGEDGTDGKSLVEVDEGPAVCGGKGGVIYEVEGSGNENEVCNGAKGEQGEDGSPWTAGGTLPPGQVETGAWAFAATTADTEGVRMALSFAIPLAAPVDGANVHWAGEPDFTQVCPGTAENPHPEPGDLCVYANFNDFPEEVSFEGICPLDVVIQGECLDEEKTGASTTGAVLVFSTPTSSDPELNTASSGAFAVRAPEAP
jgi:hypothetical protein